MNGDQFDGDDVGDTAIVGPGLILTTEALNAAAIGANPNLGLNTTARGLGINSAGAGDNASDIDLINGGTQQEFWSFSLSENIFFEGIDLIGLGNGEVTMLESPDWTGLSFTPGSSSVSFLNGVFTLSGTEPGDDFNLLDLTGGDLLPVSAGTFITITAGTSGNGSGAAIESFSFSIPEAGGLLTWTLLMGLVAVSTHGVRGVRA